ncbi:MAG: sigma-70 family RNA polymerase sigma factor [Chitinivibrionales bacterium]|nr:sigma-70 family RNA polymerase sigma factor [Chitinivibrionales bacterium]
MNDHELISAIAAGDNTAFHRLVTRYRTMVYTACYRVIGSKADAEEIAQDVFVQVFRKAGNFEGKSKVSTWLYRIAVNLSLNFLRKQKWSRLFSPLSPTDEQTDSAMIVLPGKENDQPDARMNSRAERHMLQRALASLPGKQKAAFLLHKYDGLSYQEIADTLNTSLSSIESLIYRARKSLQKILTAEMQKNEKTARVSPALCCLIL